MGGHRKTTQAVRPALGALTQFNLKVDKRPSSEEERELEPILEDTLI